MKEQSKIKEEYMEMWNEELNEEYKEGEIMKREICPICKQEIIGYPALSRIDNKTKICSDCGTKEAIDAFIKKIKSRN